MDPLDPRIFGYVFEDLGDSKIVFTIEGCCESDKTDTVSLLKEVRSWIDKELLRIDNGTVQASGNSEDRTGS